MVGRRSRAMEVDSIEAEVVSHDSVPRISNTVAGKSPVKQKGPPLVPGPKRRKSEKPVTARVELGSDDSESDHDDDDLAHNDAIAFHDRFFEASKRTRTSNNTLKIDKNAVQKKVEELAEVVKPHPCGEFSCQFDYWKVLLSQQYNILLHGVGSKTPVMKAFRKELHDEGYDTVCFNAFKDDATEKGLFDAILTDLLNDKPGTSLENSLNKLLDYYSDPDAYQLIMFINNIESNSISRSYNLLLKLVNLPKVHLVSSIDKIYGTFAFDQSQLATFNFITMETTTFMPYVLETKTGHNLWTKTQGKIGLASLQHVFDSLTGNGKGVLKIIIKEQIEQTKQRKDGPSFKELYKLCRKNFLVNSETALKAQLVELKDHQLIGDGTQVIRIQLQVPQLEQFLRTNQ